LAIALGCAVSGAQAAGDKFKLTSPDVKPRATIDNKYVFKTGGCKGDNVSPALSWSGAPEGTKSFVLTVYDPDAPTGSGFWHWVVVNIPAGVTELKLDAGNPKAGLLPTGALQTRTDFGAPGYGGPCPPEGHGPHRYVFTLFAVKQETLPVAADTSAAIVGFQLHFNTIEKVSLTGVFKR
jgi:Raf kinase inhibitor-like YbhB/YbcL family protein